MKYENGHVIMDKEEFMINNLMQGVAAQLIAERSDETLEWWINRLIELAEEQLTEIKNNHPGFIEQSINSCVKASND